VIASSSARLVAWRCRKGRTCAGVDVQPEEISTSSSGCMAEGEHARVHRPSRLESRCDRYCSGFSEFIRPWRGSRAAEWFLPFGDALGDHVTKVAAVLVRECARRTVGVDQREAYWLMGSLFDGAPRK